MKNTVILEMINNGEIEELKNLLQDEIYNDSLKGNGNKALEKPCIIDFEGRNTLLLSMDIQ